MKLVASLVGAALLAASVSPALAEDPCVSIGKMAYAAMLARQNMQPISSVIAVANGIQAAPQIKRLLRTIIIAAYKLPDFQSEEYRTRQAAHFVNQVEAICYEQVMK